MCRSGTLQDRKDSAVSRERTIAMPTVRCGLAPSCCHLKKLFPSLPHFHIFVSFLICFGQEVLEVKWSFSGSTTGIPSSALLLPKLVPLLVQVQVEGASLYSGHPLALSWSRRQPLYHAPNLLGVVNVTGASWLCIVDLGHGWAGTVSQCNARLLPGRPRYLGAF